MTDNPRSIADLCRALPDSEGELRERFREFNRLVSESVLMRPITRTSGDASGVCEERYPCAPLFSVGSGDSIVDAKAATDAILKRSRPNLRWQFWLRDDPDGYCCCLILRRLEGKWQQFEAIASTEEMARSTCALLAAHSLDFVTIGTTT